MNSEDGVVKCVCYNTEVIFLRWNNTKKNILCNIEFNVSVIIW